MLKRLRVAAKPGSSDLQRLAVRLWGVLAAPRTFYNSGALWAQVPFVAFIVFWECWIRFQLRPFPIGFAIAALALVAVVITVRVESKWSRREQAVWLIVAFLLFYLESRTLFQDRGEQDAQHAEEMAQFGRVLQQNRRDFKETMAASKGIFNKTKQAADTANEAVNTMTGGRGYCFLQLDPSPDPQVGELVPQLVVKGRYPLSDVGMRITDYRAWNRDFLKLAASGLTAANAANLDSVYTDLGIVPRNGVIFLSPRPLGIDLSTSNMDKRYNIEFSAMNGNWREILRVRKIGDQWVDAVAVYRFDVNGDKRPAVYMRVNKLLLDPNGTFDWDYPPKPMPAGIPR